jgi:hypothetical protein
LKIKIKLSIMMVAIVLIVAGGIAIIELVQASNITMALSQQKTMYLARQCAQYWDGRIDGYIKVLQTLSNVWKPNAIDGQDSRNIGRVGSTETGQFAFALSREN